LSEYLSILAEIIIMCLEYARKSWEVYIKNPMPFLWAIVLTGLIQASGSALTSLFIFGSPFAIFSESISSETIAEMPGLGFGVAFMILTVVIVLIMNTGIYGMAAESLKKKTSLATMARTINSKWAYAILANVIILMIAIIAAFPAIMVMLSPLEGTYLVLAMALSGLFLLGIVILFALVYPALIESKSAVQAVKLSVYVVRRNYIQAVLLIAFFLLLSSIISIIPLIGQVIAVLVIMPCSSIALTYFYQKNKKKS